MVFLASFWSQRKGRTKQSIISKNLKVSRSSRLSCLFSAAPSTRTYHVNVFATVRGNDLLKAKDLSGALAAYTEAIELDGSDAAFRSNRSAVYMSMKEYEKALVDAEV